MKKLYILILVFFFFVKYSNGQNDTLLNEPIVADFDAGPVFSGGQEALNKYFSSSIVYPPSQIASGSEGIVYVSFVVNSAGKVKKARVLRSTNINFDDEALRVVNMMPDWQPATKNQKPVSVLVNVPIRFMLNVKDDEIKKD